MSQEIEDAFDEFYVDTESEFSEDDVDSDTEDSDVDIITPGNRSTCRIISSDSESNLEDSDSDADEWSENDKDIYLEEYNRISGVNIIPENKESVLDVMQLFIGNDLLELFTTETNRYRVQVLYKYKENKIAKWTDVTIQEMKKFLGLLILMGQVRKGTLYDYWSTSPYIETPIFSKTMSRNRFIMIWKMWHFCNNDMMIDKSDRLFKIRNVINYMENKFRTVYTPKQQLSLDEGIIAWRGKLCFRTYNPAKLTKYGILLRMVCEAESGYVCNFKVYSGAGTKLQQTILLLLSPFSGFNHHVYMDNYYNSVNTAEALLTQNIRICGTMRLNRGIPIDLKRIKMKEGETNFRRKNDVLLQLWQSKKRKTVKTISTIHSAKMIDTTTRSGKTISKPESVVEYNKFMKGVDRADQYLSYYNILRKTTKWTKKATLYFLNCALFNSFMVYKKLNKTKMNYKKFLLEAAIQLIKEGDMQSLDIMVEEPSTSRERTKPSPRFDPPDRLSMNMKKHKLVPIVTGGKKKYPHRRCRVCSSNGKTGYTRYICKNCGVPLHKLTCFEIYHTLQKY